MALNIDNILKNALCNLQILIDKIELNIGVGQLNNDDWKYLSGCNSHLNWDSIVTDYSNYESSVNMSVKFRDNANSALLGASICMFDMEEKSFNVCGVERFSRKTTDCPLQGKMVFLIIAFAFLISSVVGLDFVRLVDVDKNSSKLRNYYKTFGFDVEPNNPQNMIVDFKVLENNLK